MKLEFNDLLMKSGFDPAQVRLLRHQVKAPTGCTPYSLWRDRRPEFEAFQNVQAASNRAKMEAPYWASFVVPSNGTTLFAGLYAVKRVGVIDSRWTDPLFDSPGFEAANESRDHYETQLSDGLANYIGCVLIEWGSATRTWIQRADRQNKEVVELRREFKEDQFPGYTRFIARVSEIESMPRNWITALRAARGVYLLSSVKTREQYVGSASGEGGFHARWLNYAADGHGGNIGLKSNDPSDYQVSILEVSGSSLIAAEIREVEQLWKRKLQSRDMGLNRN